MGLQASLISHMVQQKSSRTAQAANLFGRVAETVTRGLYKNYLSRGAREIVGQDRLEIGDTLSISSGQVRKNGQVIFQHETLFRGINIEQIDVTKEMCHAKGMTNYLRWEAIGHRAHSLSALLSTLGTIPSLGLSYLFFKYVPIETSSFGAISYLVIISLFVVPFYRILSLIPQEHKDSKANLGDVDRHKLKSFFFKQVNVRGIMYPLLPGVIFVNNAEGPQDAEIITFHEKVHSLGGSEYRAEQLTRAYIAKGVFAKKTLPALHLLRNLFGILSRNFALIRFGTSFYRVTYRELSCIADDKTKLQAFLDREPEGNFTHAIAARLLGLPERASTHYEKILEKINSQLKNERSPYLGGLPIREAQRLVLLAIAIGYQEAGNLDKAREFLKKIIRLKTDCYFSPVLLAAAKKTIVPNL